MYKQVTTQGLAHPGSSAAAVTSDLTAYRSIRSGFEDYFSHYNDGRPFVVIGHSQGAAMLILLLSHLVDDNAALRKKMVLAIILGGNVEVPTDGRLVGGSFSNIPLCNKAAETGCVIAYSSFSGMPPKDAMFGRPGQGASLQSGQFAKAGLAVACVNPGSIGGGSSDLTPVFPSQGKIATPWVTFPGLYRATCEHQGGATWLQVSKATGASDRRPVVKAGLGPTWGYHEYDVNLALGNLISDVAASEASWSRTK